jgi:hypothetical protein
VGSRFPPTVLLRSETNDPDTVALDSHRVALDYHRVASDPHRAASDYELVPPVTEVPDGHRLTK